MALDAFHAHRQQAAADLYRLGRDCVKNGELARAQQLLRQAVEYDRDLSEAWLWLAATTYDPAAQKQYLEWAIAAKPGNVAARRALAIISRKIKTQAFTPSTFPPAAPHTETAAVQQTFACPQCGGRLHFDPELVDLKCESCGFVEVVDETPTQPQEQVLDFVLPTRQSQRWAEAERLMVCQQCGARTLFPSGHTSLLCPFCGQAAFAVAPEDAELIAPQALLPMAFEAEQAQKLVRRWLGQGFFTPDNLMAFARHAGLRPAYVPFWLFSATATTSWRAYEGQGYGRDRTYLWVTGDLSFFFTDYLVPGIRTLSSAFIKRVTPFDLTKLVEYKPAYLAGWPATTFDVSLADASLTARAEMAEQARQQALAKLSRSERTSLEITQTDFSGQTYKLVLLPVWLGAYPYHGRSYLLLVNGQTGKVAGEKPTDWLKVAIVAVGVLVLLAGLALFLFLVLR